MGVPKRLKTSHAITANNGKQWKRKGEKKSKKNKNEVGEP